MKVGGVLRDERRPAGWWGRPCTPTPHSCKVRRKRPPPFVPVTDLARPVECVESYITTGVPPVRSANFKMFLMRAGVAELSGPFGTRTVKTGDLVLLSAGTVWGSVSLAPVDVVCAYFNPGFLTDQMRWTLPGDVTDRRAAARQLYDAIAGVRSFHLNAAQAEVFGAHFDRLLCLSNQGGSFGEKFVAATQLIWLIGELFASTETIEAPPVTGVELWSLRREVRIALDLLQRDYDRSWTTAALADHVALSESALRRAFYRAIGMTPREYLHRVRLMRFEQFVAGSAVSIGEAARRVGWDSGDYARRVFVRNHGVTPREFRADAYLAQSRYCSGGCVLAHA